MLEIISYSVSFLIFFPLNKTYLYTLWCPYSPVTGTNLVKKKTFVLLFRVNINVTPSLLYVCIQKKVHVMLTQRNGDILGMPLGK